MEAKTADEAAAPANAMEPSAATAHTPAVAAEANPATGSDAADSHDAAAHSGASAADSASSDSNAIPPALHARPPASATISMTSIESDALAAIDALCAAHPPVRRPAPAASAVFSAPPPAAHPKRVKQVKSKPSIRPLPLDGEGEVDFAAAIVAPVIPASRASAAASAASATATAAAAQSNSAGSLHSVSLLASDWRAALDSWAEEPDEDDPLPPRMDTDTDSAATEEKSSVPAAASPADLTATDAASLSSDAGTAPALAQTAASLSNRAPLPAKSSASAAPAPAGPSSADLDCLVAQWALEEQEAGTGTPLEED